MGRHRNSDASSLLARADEDDDTDTSSDDPMEMKNFPLTAVDTLLSSQQGNADDRRYPQNLSVLAKHSSKHSGQHSKKKSRQPLSISPPSTTSTSSDHSPTRSSYRLSRDNTANLLEILHPQKFLSVCSLSVVIITILGVFIAFFIFDSFMHYQRDPDGCSSSYTRPHYIKQEKFDSELTRFAGKYALHLYREKPHDFLDEINPRQPSGIPVLFIPGHAGSFRQVRNIAAECAALYYQQVSREPGSREQGARNLDFFTVDFNEEFSAVHGHSLLEQAEYLNDAIGYILSLYPQSRQSDPYTSNLPDPTAVIIVAHSMGGIVARTMFTMPNFQPGTINTVFTFSTPHILPPLPLDWKMSLIYKTISEFWRNGYTNTGAVAPISEAGSSSSSAVSPATSYPISLSDVTLISFVGGNLDTIISSDSADIQSVVPTSHGFTIFTTAIPDVWVGCDHPAILWCGQLLKVFARSLLDVIDVRRPGQTKNVERRMEIFRKAYLSGFERSHVDVIASGLLKESVPTINLAELQHSFLKKEQRLIHPVQAGMRKPQIHLMPIPQSSASGLDTFALLTDQQIGRDNRLDVFACNLLSLSADEKDELSDQDIDDIPVAPTSRLSCHVASSNVVLVPASTMYDDKTFSGRTFQFLRLRAVELEGHRFVAIMDRGGFGPGNGFLMAEFYSDEGSTLMMDNSKTDLLLNGLHVTGVPFKHTLISTLKVPGMDNQLLAYHLFLSRPTCRPNEQLFAPFVRQSLPFMYESKFHVNVHEADITFHGRPPFYSNVPSEENKGVVLEFWADPSCPGPLDIDLVVDWYGSLGKIVMRYELVAASFPFVVVILVVRAQLNNFNRVGEFPHFGQGLAYVLRKTLLFFLPFLGVISIYQCTSDVTPLPNLGDFLKLDLGTAKRSFDVNDILLGNHDIFFWWLPLAFTMLSIGIVVIIWVLLSAIIMLFAVISILVGRRGPVARLIVRQRESRIRKFSRRVITTLVLFLLVATLIPYQFAFVVAFLIHVVSCVRAATRAMSTVDSLRRQHRWGRFYYFQSILILLFVLLPFNLPILAVWIRNLSVNWYQPFSSDHSILAIAPFMIYVEIVIGGKMLPRTTGIWMRWATNGILFFVITYALFYGVRYTHSIYFLSNLLVFWLVILHSRDSVIVMGAIRNVLEHWARFTNKKRS